MEKWQIIVNTLAKEIVSGKYGTNGYLESERKLASRFGVARETVRKALNILKKRQLIGRQSRKVPRICSSSLKGLKLGMMISGFAPTDLYRAVGDKVVELACGKSMEVIFGDLFHDEEDYDESVIYASARKLIDKGIRGVILLPVQNLPDSDKVNRKLVKMFRDADVQIVLIDCDITRKPNRSDLDLVDIDNFDAGHKAAEHVVSQGAKNIVFLARGGHGNTVSERIQGAECVRNHAEVRCAYVKSVSDYDHIKEVLVECGVFDCVIGQNDTIAMNAAAVLTSMGRQIPKDVMLVGFDDLETAGKVCPGLTSVSQPCEQLAALSFNRVLERINDPSIAPVHFQSVAKLVVRGSTERNWNAGG